jgi:hypothetical protein
MTLPQPTSAPSPAPSRDGWIALPADLVGRLTAFRSRVRRIKFLEAVCLAVCGVALAFLAVFLCDRLGETPAVVRLAVLLAAVAACLAVPLAIRRWGLGLASLEQVGMADYAARQISQLSGGQQQRLALACAIVGRPELVFLDEPTAGMDAHARLVVWELIDGLRRDGVTVVLTTHQLQEAEELADRIVIIDRGSTVASGTPAELMRSGAENQLRFTAPRKLDLSLLVTALPEGYRVTEPTPGEYLVEGAIDPQVERLHAQYLAAASEA